MKTTMLSLAAILMLSFSNYAQSSPSCNANVEALELQIRLLAEQLGDQEILDELDALKAEDETLNKITLTEHDPEPFAISDQIDMTIPTDAENVEVVFTNRLGQQLKKISITERGNTTLTIYMSERLKDSYSYSMIMD